MEHDLLCVSLSSVWETDVVFNLLTLLYDKSHKQIFTKYLRRKANRSFVLNKIVELLTQSIGHVLVNLMFCKNV